MENQEKDKAIDEFAIMVRAIHLRELLNQIDGEASEITTADVLDALATANFGLSYHETNPAAGAYIKYLAERLNYKRNENELLAEYGGDFDEAFMDWMNENFDEEAE